MADTVEPELNHSLDEIAAELGVSRERAGQIVRTAMRNVRLELDRLGLTFEDLVGER